MGHSIRFETPENISVSYRVAGLGTRFVAWLVDVFLIAASLLAALLASLLLMTAAGQSPLAISFLSSLGVVALAFLVVANGFAFFAYFAVFEWFTNGQTPGKRSVQIRTVMAGGFSLTFTAVVIRNLFRLLDALPLFWFVPLISANSQRFGDMVAGTVVVVETRPRLERICEQLLSRPAEQARFTFTAAQLDALQQSDFRAISTYLERRVSLRPGQDAELAGRLMQGIAARLDLAPMTAGVDQQEFFMDLLAAKLRRDLRELG